MLRVSFVIRSTEIHPVFFGLLPTSFCFSSNQPMLLAIMDFTADFTQLHTASHSFTLHTASHSFTASQSLASLMHRHPSIGNSCAWNLLCLRQVGVHFASEDGFL